MVLHVFTLWVKKAVEHSLGKARILHLTLRRWRPAMTAAALA
jgi:hypothetical protein